MEKPVSMNAEDIRDEKVSTNVLIRVLIWWFMYHTRRCWYMTVILTKLYFSLPNLDT